MKPFLLSLLLSISLFAEAPFDQVQKLINNKQYDIAAASLEIIIQNHPQSSKAYYTLAQSYAGLGKLSEANQALAKAQAINPTLSFVPVSDVASLKQAITPQTQLIKPVEPESHTALYIFLAILAGAIFYGYYKLKPKPEPVITTPEPSKAYEPYVYKEPKPYEPVYTRPSQSTTVHHHHHSDNTMSTIATAAVTSAAVAMLMDDDTDNTPTHSYQPDLSSYQDDYRSATWDEPKSSSSSSWSDSSSSSSSSSDSSWSE